MDNKDKRSFASTSLRTIDENEMTIDHVVNTKTLDRYNTFVLPKGAIVKNFLKNPVVLWLHNVDGNTAKIPIAKCIDIKITEDEIKVKTKFNENDALAVKVFNAYKDGFLNAWSIGFQPKTYTRYEEENRKELNKKFGLKVTVKQIEAAGWMGMYVIDTWELHEYSAVPVPANPEALNLEEQEQHCLALATRGLSTETDFSKLDLEPEEKAEEKVTEKEIEEVAKEEEKEQDKVEDTELEPEEKKEEVKEEEAEETEEEPEVFVKEKKEPTEEEKEEAEEEAEKTELEKEQDKNDGTVPEPEEKEEKKEDVEDLVIVKETEDKPEENKEEVPEEKKEEPKEEPKEEKKEEAPEVKPEEEKKEEAQPGEKIQVETLLDVIKIVTKKLEALEKEVKIIKQQTSVDNLEAIRAIEIESKEEDKVEKDFSLSDFMKKNIYK